MAVYFNGKNVKRLLLLTGHLWRETENYAVAMEILLIPGYFLHTWTLLIQKSILEGKKKCIYHCISVKNTDKCYYFKIHQKYLFQSEIASPSLLIIPHCEQKEYHFPYTLREQTIFPFSMTLIYFKWL